MFAIVLAALDRSGSVLPILYAMGVHELAHVVMMLACGGRVRRLTLRFADLRIDAAGLGFAVCAALLLAGIILTFFRRAGLWPLGTAAYLTLRLLTLAKRTGE